MSYENVPKNTAKDAVLVEQNGTVNVAQTATVTTTPANIADTNVNVTNSSLDVNTRVRAPDYTVATSSTTFPTPGDDEEGAVLEVIANGNRFVWNGTSWIASHSVGAQNVHLVEVLRQPFSTQLYAETGESSTVATASASQDRDLVLADATGFVAGNRIRIGEAEEELSMPVIISIATNTLTLDRLLDVAHDVGTTVTEVTAELNIVATSAAPTVYMAAPPSTETWHITRLMVTMTHGSSGDLGLFGNLDELTYGVIGRTFNELGYTTIFDWKTNGDMNSTMYDVKFDDRSGGGGDYGTSGRFTLTKLGGPLVLRGSQGAMLEILLQDDLSDLDSFEITAQGYIAETLIVTP